MYSDAGSAAGTSPSRPALPADVEDDTPATRWHVLKRLFAWPALLVVRVALLMKHQNAGTAGEYSKSNDPQSDMSYVHAAMHDAGSIDGSILPEIQKPVLQDNLRITHKKLDEFTFSTSFSGVDTPSTSFLMVATYLNAMLGLGIDKPSLPTFKNLWACEWNSTSRTELLDHPHGPMHLFDDIGKFWTPSVLNRIPSFVNFALIETILLPLVMTGFAVVDFAHCHCCGQLCRALWFGKAPLFSLFRMVIFIYSCFELTSSLTVRGLKS
mgnify:CR=1 FL=1